MALRNPAIPIQEAWIAPTFVNSWINYGLGFNPCGYWKDSYNVVHLRGLVKNGAIGSVLFTLPVGYRPANTEGFPVIRAVAPASEVGRLDISNAGIVLCQAFVAASTATVDFMFLDGITFRASQ